MDSDKTTQTSVFTVCNLINKVDIYFKSDQFNSKQSVLRKQIFTMYIPMAVFVVR